MGDGHTGDSAHERESCDGRDETPGAGLPTPAKRSGVTSVLLERSIPEHACEQVHVGGVLGAVGAPVEVASEGEAGELVQLAVEATRHPCMRTVADGAMDRHPGVLDAALWRKFGHLRGREHPPSAASGERNMGMEQDTDEDERETQAGEEHRGVHHLHPFGAVDSDAAHRTIVTTVGTHAPTKPEGCSCGEEKRSNQHEPERYRAERRRSGCISDPQGDQCRTEAQRGHDGREAPQPASDHVTRRRTSRARASFARRFPRPPCRVRAPLGSPSPSLPRSWARSRAGTGTRRGARRRVG